LSPRHLGEREVLGAEITKLLLGLKEEQEADKFRSVARWIEQTVSHLRRHWRRLPHDLIVLAHSYRENTSLVLCESMPAGSQSVWMECVKLKGRVNILGEWILETELACNRLISRASLWCGTFPVTRVEESEQRVVVCIRGTELLLPAFDVRYRDPGSCKHNE